MTPWMQVRLWYRKAAPAERTPTLVAIAVLTAVFVASIAMQPSDDEVVADEGFVGGELDAGDGDAPVPGGGSGATSTTVAGGGGSGGLVGGGGSSGGSPTTAGGTGGGGGNGSGGSVTLTASDRGVSERQIKLGFMLQNPGGLNSAGFSTGQRSDGPEYIEAMARWANRRGGVAGREVVPVFRFTDPTSVEDQAAACRALVDDGKVFGVVDVASVLDTASLDCFTNRSKGDTPFVHSVMWSRDWQARSGGNDVSYQAAVDRISVTWARDLAAMGWFPKGAKVGILGDKCPATEPTIVNVLAPALRARGAGEVLVGNHDCDIQSVVSQPPNIATRFRLERVTHVLIVSNFVSAQVFISAMASQGWKPKYSTSDWFLNTSDNTSANFNPNQFDGAVGIASYGGMLKDSGKTPYRGWQTCSEIATESGLPPIAPGDKASEELLGLCDNFLLMIAAIEGAGPNPTRAGWRAAVQRLGMRTSAVFGRSRFAPGKFTGSDYVHTLRWRRDCRCWRSVSGFRAAAA